MKLVKELFDHTPGVMFVSRMTCIIEVRAWPASEGIRKMDGCVWYRPASILSRFWCLRLSKRQCKRTYFDYPPGSSAWKVTPHGKHWLWERVDHLLELL